MQGGGGQGYGGPPPRRPPMPGGGPGWGQPQRPLPDTEVLPRGRQGRPQQYRPTEARPPQRGRGGPPPGGRPRRPRWGRRIGLVLVALLVLVIAGGVWVEVSLSRTAALPSDSAQSSSGTNWLIVGSDSRQKLTPEEKERYATGDEVSQLTDTIMLLHTGSGPTTLVSIPRDSLLNIPGHGVAKVNSAYGKGGGPDGGGPKLLVQTIEAATGLRIDHYAEIGFLGIVKVVDSVGGVELDVPESITDPKAALDIKKGVQVLDGPTALGYVRTRATASSDFGRVERQRALLSALLDKVTSPATLLNPFRIVPLAGQLTSAITVDSGDHTWNLAQLGLAMRGIGSGISTTVPVADGEVHWDKKRASALFDALAKDQEPPKTALGP
jgi:LCP family protein required for cell wall assembly